jgi:predicted nucleotidyltransferase
MPKLLTKIIESPQCHPPSWIPTGIHYATLMGSQAYGTNNEDSDIDVYGFCIPPLDMIFPHTAGHIPGFGRQIQRFEQWQESHITGDYDKEADITIFSIVKYFNLLMENNPNIVDSIFTPLNCVLQITQVGQLVRDNRKIFLHKGSYHKFLGYSRSQLAKMGTTKENTSGKRREIRDRFGFDVKFATHVVRLLCELEMILEQGDIDLQRDREHLKSIRRGDYSQEDIISWATEKEKHLTKLYETSTLQYSPDEDKIKQLLLQCLEHHFGNLDKAIYQPGKADSALMEIKAIVERVV